MNLTDVIRRPLVTEKTSILREDGRTIVFHVASHATKIQIKRAVEQLIGKKVEAVRTANCDGKLRRQRRADAGRTNHWKKAIVRLKQGESFDLV